MKCNSCHASESRHATSSAESTRPFAHREFVPDWMSCARTHPARGATLVSPFEPRVTEWRRMAGRGALARALANSDDLRGDRQRDLWSGLRADLEPDRDVNAVEGRRVDPIRSEKLLECAGPRTSREQANVCGLFREHRPQNRQLELVVVSHDHDVRRGIVSLAPREHLHVADEQLVR